MSVLCIVGFGILTLIDLPGLIRDKSWRELAAYSALMCLGLTVCLMYAWKIDIPNPVRDTQYFVKGLLRLSYD